MATETQTRRLLECITDGNLRMAEHFLLNGADPNYVLPMEGVAAMHIASGCSESAVKLLIKFGGDPNVRSVDGTTPTHVAAAWGDITILHLLLKNGGDPLSKDQDGFTVIENAESYGHYDCLALLEYFTLQLAPDEDYLNTPDVTVTSRENFHNYGQQQFTPRKNPEENDFEDENFTDLEDYLDWALQHQGSAYSDQITYKLKKYLQNRHESHVALDVTSPDHPTLEMKKECSFSDSIASSVDINNQGFRQDSLHVHWADQLATSCLYSGRISGTRSSSSSNDSFMTCYSDLADNTIENVKTPKKVATFGSDSSSALHATVTSANVPEEPTSRGDARRRKVRCHRTVQEWLMRNGDSLQPEQSGGKIKDKFLVPVGDLRNSTRSLEQDSRWRPPNVVLDCNESDLLTSDDSHVRDSKISQKHFENADGSVFKNDISDMFSSIDLNDTITYDVDEYFPSAISDPQNIRNAYSVESSVSVDSSVLNKSDETHSRRRSVDSAYSDCPTEDYVYIDKERGITLIERRIPTQVEGKRTSLDSQGSALTSDSQKTEIYDWKSLLKNTSQGSKKTRARNVGPSSSCRYSQDSVISVSSFDSETTECYDCEKYQESVTPISSEVSSIPERLSQLSNEEIREMLQSLGDEPGPVTANTRQTYLCRLAKAEQDPQSIQFRLSLTPGYTPELTAALEGRFDMTGISDLEEKMVAAFQNPPKNRKWREGTLKSSFNYLLLDPRVTKNLPNRTHQLGELNTFKTFVSAIFYVGKGKRSRPYSHLYEAIKPKETVSDKVQQILDIWQEDLGVVSLHCFQSVIPVEAYTREACIVDALGLNNLTNKKRGDYYGISTTFSMKQKRQLGVSLLKKSLQIFLAEGERQICPCDIDLGQ